MSMHFNLLTDHSSKAAAHTCENTQNENKST